MNLHYSDYENTLAYVIDSINNQIKNNLPLIRNGLFEEGEIQDIKLKEIGLEYEIIDEFNNEQVRILIHRFALKIVGILEWKMMNVITIHHPNVVSSDYDVYMPYDYKIILNDENNIEIESQYELETTENSILNILSMVKYKEIVEEKFLELIILFFNK